MQILIAGFIMTLPPMDLNTKNDSHLLADYFLFPAIRKNPQSPTLKSHRRHARPTMLDANLSDHATMTGDHSLASKQLSNHAQLKLRFLRKVCAQKNEQH